MDTTLLKLDPQGRVLIPKQLRTRLGISSDTELHSRIEGESLILETRKAILARMREEARRVDSGRSMVDELIADRRLDAAREPRA